MVGIVIFLLLFFYFMFINTKLYNRNILSAHEECRLALQSLGFLISVVGSRGSHNAKVYIPEEDQDRFDSEILGNSIVGRYRTFYFSKVTQYGLTIPDYWVSYNMR